MSAAFVAEGKTVSRGMGGEDKLGPELWRDIGERSEAQRPRLGAIEGIGKGFLQSCNFGDLGMSSEARIRLQEIRNVTPEVPGASPIRRVGGDVGLGQSGETSIAKIGMHLLVIVGQHLREPGDIGIAVDAEQHLPLFLGAVLDLRKDGVVAGENAALEAFLQLFEAAHSAAARLAGPSTSRAMLRAWSSSSTSSASGGMLSSRSIMVDTGPK
jgi:hypothetical protein